MSSENKVQASGQPWGSEASADGCSAQEPSHLPSGSNSATLIAQLQHQVREMWENEQFLLISAQASQAEIAALHHRRKQLEDDRASLSATVATLHAAHERLAVSSVALLMELHGAARLSTLEHEQDEWFMLMQVLQSPEASRRVVIIPSALVIGEQQTTRVDNSTQSVASLEELQADTSSVLTAQAVAEDPKASRAAPSDLPSAGASDSKETDLMAKLDAQEALLKAKDAEIAALEKQQDQMMRRLEDSWSEMRELECRSPRSNAAQLLKLQADMEDLKAENERLHVELALRTGQVQCLERLNAQLSHDYTARLTRLTADSVEWKEWVGKLQENQPMSPQVTSPQSIPRSPRSLDFLSPQCDESLKSPLSGDSLPSPLDAAAHAQRPAAMRLEDVSSPAENLGSPGGVLSPSLSIGHESSGEESPAALAVATLQLRNEVLEDSLGVMSHALQRVAIEGFIVGTPLKGKADAAKGATRKDALQFLRRSGLGGSVKICDSPRVKTFTTAEDANNL